MTSKRPGYFPVLTPPLGVSICVKCSGVNCNLSYKYPQHNTLHKLYMRACVCVLYRSSTSTASKYSGTTPSPRRRKTKEPNDQLDQHRQSLPTVGLNVVEIRRKQREILPTEQTRHTQASARLLVKVSGQQSQCRALELDTNRRRSADLQRSN